MGERHTYTQTERERGRDRESDKVIKKKRTVGKDKSIFPLRFDIMIYCKQEPQAINGRFKTE